MCVCVCVRKWVHAFCENSKRAGIDIYISSTVKNREQAKINKSKTIYANCTNLLKITKLNGHE